MAVRVSPGHWERSLDQAYAGLLCREQCSSGVWTSAWSPIYTNLADCRSCWHCVWLSKNDF